MNNQPINETVLTRRAKSICGFNQFRALNKFLDTETKIVSTSYVCVKCGEKRLSLSHNKT